MVKYMVCIIHRWFRWSNIWFASYTDGSDGQIYAHNHRKKNYFFLGKKKCFPYIDSSDGQIYGLHHT